MDQPLTRCEHLGGAPVVSHNTMGQRAHSMLSRIYALRRFVNSEERFIAGVLARYVPLGGRVLDVGCGRGRFHAALTDRGVRYVGVDVNADTVAYNRSLGRDVYFAANFPERGEPFDAIVLSHIVEHFAHSELVVMLNKYLPRLRCGGVVIILTPLYHRGFYDDFDHVKPYNPAALRQLFCGISQQTQGFGLRGGFTDLECWFKRDPLWHSHRSYPIMHLASVPMFLAYIATASRLGRLTGYGMVLRKDSE